MNATCARLACLSLALALQAAPATAQKHPGAAQAPRVPRGYPAQDCNGNGIPDLTDIYMGTSADCQQDGIPDECQLAVPFAYVYDDGQMNGSLGTTVRHVAWMTQHVVQAGAETITGIELAWGQVAVGKPANLGLWLDPDGDADPTDAVLLVQTVAYSVSPQTGVIVEVDVPDTYIGPPGTSFFVGAWGEFEPFPTEYPAAVDDNSLTRRSWWITSDTPIDPDDLSSGAIVEFGLLGDFCPCDGDWMIRALSCDGGHCGESADGNANGLPDECEDCNANGLPDDIDLANGTSTDCDGDGIPDECALPDCDGNGHADLCQSLAGQGLAGEYYPNKTLQGTPLARIDPMVFFDFLADPPFPGHFPSKGFSVRWTGTVVTAAAGTHTFALQHERGVRLWVDGVLVIDDWWDGIGFDTGTIDLPAAGEHFVKLEYFNEGGSPHVELWWQPPGGTLAPIQAHELRPILDLDADGTPDPCQFADCNGNGVEDGTDLALGTAVDCDGDGTPDSCQACEDRDQNHMLDACELVAGPGLVGQYWYSEAGPAKRSFYVGNRVDAAIDFDWGPGAPLAGVKVDNFTVRWTGTLNTPPVSGTYGLHLLADDGVRLRLDGALLIDEWHPSSGQVYMVNVPLAASTGHVLELDYYESGGDARINLSWTVPGASTVTIPSSAFEPDTDVDGDGFPDLYIDDCDGNGVPDPLDLSLGNLTDLDGNCVPDECQGGTGYWRFEEAGGPTILDSTPNAQSGWLSALPERTSDVPVLVVPQLGLKDLRALDLGWQDVSNGGLATVPDALGLLEVGGQSFTLEAWVRLDRISDTSGPDQRQWLFQKKPDPGPDSALDYGFLVQAGSLPGASTGSELAFAYGDGTLSHAVVSDLRIQDLDWHFVSLAWSSSTSTLRFGLDGVFETTWFRKPALWGGGPLQIGAHRNASGAFNQFLRGSIDEARVSRLFLEPELLLDHEPE